VFLLAIVYRLLGGFDDEELTSLLTLISSVSAIYIGALFKYIGDSIKEGPEQTTEDKEISVGKLIIWIVPIHCIILAAFISAKAFTLITFKQMNICLGALEVIFGGFLGVFIDQIFPSRKN
jgi:hypothetical protein